MKIKGQLQFMLWNYPWNPTPEKVGKLELCLLLVKHGRLEISICLYLLLIPAKSESSIRNETIKVKGKRKERNRWIL